VQSNVDESSARDVEPCKQCTLPGVGLAHPVCDLLRKFARRGAPNAGELQRKVAGEIAVICLARSVKPNRWNVVQHRRLIPSRKAPDADLERSPANKLREVVALVVKHHLVRSRRWRSPYAPGRANIFSELSRCWSSGLQ